MPSYKKKSNEKGLNDFFNDVKEILEYVVTNIREFVLDRDNKFYELVNTVWEEDICKKFDKIKKELNAAKPKDLKAEGLSGNQLRLKLMQFYYRKKLFDEVRKRNPKGKRKFWRFRIRERFKQLASLIDKIADSVEKISGTVGVVKEFKDILSDAANGENPSSTISEPPRPFRPIKISKGNEKNLNKIPQPVKSNPKGNAKVSFY